VRMIIVRPIAHTQRDQTLPNHLTGFYKRLRGKVNKYFIYFINIFGGWWRWELVSPGGVAPSQMVSVSASVNLPLHHKVQKFSSGTSSPGWSRKKGRKMVVVWCVVRGKLKTQVI